MLGTTETQTPWPGDGSKPSRYHNPAESTHGQRVLSLLEDSQEFQSQEEQGWSPDPLRHYRASRCPDPAVLAMREF